MGSFREAANDTHPIDPDECGDEAGKRQRRSNINVVVAATSTAERRCGFLQSVKIQRGAGRVG